MSVPPGWKLVPKQLTNEMRVAAKRALKDYIESLSPDARARMPHDERGIRVPVNLKFDLRYIAAIEAAPEPPPMVGDYEADYSTPDLDQPTGAEELLARSSPAGDET